MFPLTSTFWQQGDFCLSMTKLQFVLEKNFLWKFCLSSMQDIRVRMLVLVPCWLFCWLEKKILINTEIFHSSLELRIFSQVSWTSISVLFLAETRLFSWSSFSNAYGTLLIMENFRWQLTDHGKFFLVSCLPLEKNLQKFNFFHRQLAKYQGLFKLPWLKSDHGKGV